MAIGIPIRKESNNTYDSTEDTLKHINSVASLLNRSAGDLIDRGNKHDISKLLPPEKDRKSHV